MIYIFVRIYTYWAIQTVARISIFLRTRVVSCRCAIRNDARTEQIYRWSVSRAIAASKHMYKYSISLEDVQMRSNALLFKCVNIFQNILKYFSYVYKNFRHCNWTVVPMTSRTTRYTSSSCFTSWSTCFRPYFYFFIPYRVSIEKHSHLSMLNSIDWIAVLFRTTDSNMSQYAAITFHFSIFGRRSHTKR